jgi:hypothetical protein
MLRDYYKKSIVWALVIGLFLPCVVLAGEDKRNGEGKTGRDVIFDILPPAVKEGAVRPALAITPEEIYFGDIGPEDVAHALFTLRNIGAGSLTWSTGGPEGWINSENMALTGVFKAGPDYLSLTLKSIKKDLPESADKTRPKTHDIQLTVETGGKVLLFRKELPAGAYREALNIAFAGEKRTVYLNFTVTDAKARPQLNVEPPRIDFGVASPGKQLNRQIKITNKGREFVMWRLIMPRPGGEKVKIPPLKGRYVSFFNDEIKKDAGYMPAGHLKDHLEINGKWLENEGYPSTYGLSNFMRYRFYGTGVSVYLWHGPDKGKIAVYIDDQLIRLYDGGAPERGREVLPVVDGLPDGWHVLTLANGSGRATIEGVSVYGKELMKGNPGWIAVTPDSGSTARETDYVNIRMDTQQLSPGFYGEPILLASNRGDFILETYVEIRPDQVPRFLDVYRYVRNNNYLYTTNPPAEAGRLQHGGYRKEGIGFRLFAPGTPGTTEFYRWYSARKDDHYYSYDLQRGQSLKDYAFEGSIGNIGTSRLSGTRELYRWYNPRTGCHFYTTDQRGEGMAVKGYKFEGIAGYVK